MKITCISDLHGYYPTLPGGDLLIVAGDLTARDRHSEHITFSQWAAYQKYEKVVMIAGNHDGNLRDWNPFDVENLSYLKDSECEYQGLKIWGSPWTPTFYDWYFMKDRGDPIKAMWDLIPDDVDILVTHGPAFGIQDQIEGPQKFLGCEELRSTLDRLKSLKLHVFGHIHEGYGKVVANGVIHVNASIMNERYQPVNQPIDIEL